MTISTKLLQAIFIEVNKLILDFLQKCNHPGSPKIILKKKNQSCNTCSSQFETNYKAIMIDTAWCFIKAGQGDQLKRRKGQEIEFYKAGDLVIAKVAKTIL